MLTTDPFVLKQTRSIQDASGTLLGQTLAVKDLFHIAGFPTTAGNPDWAKGHAVAQNTSPVVDALMAQGAVVVGKTITDELAYSLNGANVHYGTPQNPKLMGRLPGGSSSGSAVAVALGEADIGLGTDTGGSIRVPASYNGLYGLRPTHGVLSVEHMVGLAPEFDTVGWMNRDLPGLKQVALCLLPKTQEGKKLESLGFADDLFAFASVKTEAEQWVIQLGGSCQQLGDQLPMGMLQEAAQAFVVLQGRQIWQTHGEWISQTRPKFAQDIQQRLTMCEALTVQQEAQARVKQERLRMHVRELFKQVDVLVVPTTPGVAPKSTLSGDELVQYRQRLLSMTCLAGLCGLPQLHLPLFEIDGLPTGLSLIGPAHSDLSLIELAQQLIEKNHETN